MRVRYAVPFEFDNAPPVTHPRHGCHCCGCPLPREGDPWPGAPQCGQSMSSRSIIGPVQPLSTTNGWRHFRHSSIRIILSLLKSPTPRARGPLLVRPVTSRYDHVPTSRLFSWLHGNGPCY